MFKTNSVVSESIAKLMAAIEAGDTEKTKEAFQNYGQVIADTVKNDYITANGDAAILAQRGFRQLTAEETKYYQAIIEAGKSANPKQAYEGLTSEKVMPVTIIEDVYKELTTEHPLLSRINFQNVAYLTRWILNDHTAQTAVWGEINDEIAKEISSAFKTIEIVQCKLSAFAMIDLDMLDLGPKFLDGYVRAFLKEALYKALEKSIISGNGVKCPIGLNRDIHEGVSYSTTEGYPEKEAIPVTSFLPEEYGKILAKLAVSEKGNMRSFDEVTMVVNQVDYLTKVMPATTVLNGNGGYSTNLFPFPTEVVRSNEVTTGQAIVFLPEEYFMGVGTSKDGTLTYSDEFKFLQDKRVFKLKMHAMGKAYDNTIAVVLDISQLDPAYITVLMKNLSTAAEVDEA